MIFLSIKKISHDPLNIQTNETDQNFNKPKNCKYSIPSYANRNTNHRLTTTAPKQKTCSQIGFARMERPR